MIALADAQRRLVSLCTPLEPETVPLAHADGRVLAEDTHAADDLVPFARSAMDGFALRAADSAEQHAFRVGDTVFAHSARPRRYVPGTATPIATGGALPLGADAVVAVEDVVRDDGAIRLVQPVHRGDHVFAPGEDARRGDRLVARGTRLEPAHLGLLASAGFAHVAVTQQPRVAIVCTGSELVAVDERPGHGQIRNSNATAVRTLAARGGGLVVSDVSVPDDEALLDGALRHALAIADLVITTGGASVGERDLVKAGLQKCGVAFGFDSVAMRPGRPTALGRRGATLVIALAGNPAAAFVGLLQFVGPAIARLQGNDRPWLPRMIAQLDGTLHARPNRTYLPFVRLEGGDRLIAKPLDNQCSALTRTAVEAHGLAYIEPGTHDRRTGDDVTVDVYAWPVGPLDASLASSAAPKRNY